MHLLMVSVLLLAMLAFQPTLIYGSKGLASGSFARATGNGKKHSALSTAKSKVASLVMQMESGDVYVRKARGAGDSELAGASAGSATASNVAGNISGSGKRGKNNNNNNKKSRKNASPENGPETGHQSQSSMGRKHLDKKFTAAVAANRQHHGGQDGQHASNNNNNNNKNKQRQLLKSQHQNHGKRNGAGIKSAVGTNGDKAGNGEKAQSTCRYAKSAWTECDSKTNSKSRTLTLKKGESNCLPTRTIQKKCKKACRYEKGSWTECANGQMTRQDKLKSTGSVDSSSCEALRSINKKCNPGNGSGGGSKGTKAANKERKNKDKASRRAQQ